jgi:hypothetical protein
MPPKCGALLAAREESAQAGDASELAALAETWTKLAAQLESDEALLRALPELEVGEPYDALTLTLKLRTWPPRSNERRRIGASNRAY